MGTAVPTVGTLVNRGGNNPEVQMRGGRAAHRWRAGRGTGQDREGGRTCRMGAPFRVGKGHHVVPPLHFQTPFLLSAHACASVRCLCVCFRPTTLPRHSLLSHSASSLYSVVVLLCVLVLPSAFVVTLHLHFSLTFMYSCSDW